MEWEYQAGNQHVTTSFTDVSIGGAKIIDLTTHVVQEGVSRFCTKKDQGLQSLIEDVSIDMILHVQGKLTPLRNEYSASIKHFCGVPLEQGRADYIEISIDTSGKFSNVSGISTFEEMTPMCIHMPGLDMALHKGQGKGFTYGPKDPEFSIICAALLGTYAPQKFSGMQTVRELLRKAHKKESISLIEVCKYSAK